MEHTSKREFPMEDLKEAVLKLDEKFHIDCKNKGKEQAQKECEEEMKKNGMDKAVENFIRNIYLAFLATELFPNGEISEEIEKSFGKPAAIYVVDTEDWENLRISMTEGEIEYTSVKKVRGEIEIRTETIIQHINVLSYLLQKRIEHKTFLCKVMGELPEYLEEMRRRKNKAQRDCQRYPSKENKRLSNQLTRDFKRELTSLRYNEYEKVKCSILKR